MSEVDTAPPGTLLVLYVLGEHPDRDWWAEADLRDEIERATGHDIHASTIHRTLRSLSEVGRIRKRVIRTDGTTRTEYRLHNANSGGVDMESRT